MWTLRFFLLEAQESESDVVDEALEPELIPAAETVEEPVALDPAPEAVAVADADEPDPEPVAVALPEDEELPLLLVEPVQSPSEV